MTKIQTDANTQSVDGAGLGCQFWLPSSDLKVFFITCFDIYRYLFFWICYSN